MVFNGGALFVLFSFGLLLCACAEIKQTGRVIGHTTRDAAREIGHGTRDAVKTIGHGTRDAAREIGHGTRRAINRLETGDETD